MDHHALPASSPRRQRRPSDGSGLGVPLGRLFGVPVRLSPTWLLLAALVTYAYGQVLGASQPTLPAAVGYAVGFGFVACLVGSVLLHELGHALTSRQFGIGVRGITLEALGGYTEMEREAPRPTVELAISLAGPATSLAVGLVCGLGAAILPPATLAEQLAYQLALGNVIIAAFNALPGLPLDGGRALQAVVWAVTGDRRRGQRLAGWAGRAVAVASLVGALALFAADRIDVVGMVVTALVSLTIWTGAGQAIGTAVLAERVGSVEAARLTRPIVAVAPGTSLADAWAYAATTGPAEPVIAMADEYGQVVGLLHPPAALAVPAERRTEIKIDSLVRTVDPANVVPAGLRGLELLQAVGRDPSADYLIVEDEDVIGVLRGADLTTLLESEGLIARRTTR